jgi:hypothetical protein
MGDARGFVLIAVLGLLGLLATVALGAALAVGPEPIVAAAFGERWRLEGAADAAGRLALQQLAASPDWSGAPAAFSTSLADGVPGVRPLPDGTVLDLARETAWRTCGLAACDDASTAVVSVERPFGARNPRWRLVLHAPMDTVDGLAGELCACYLVAWVADDPLDADNDPWRDAPPGTPGHGVLWLRGAAFGARGARAEIEAVIARNCAGEGALARCEGGIRVHSWRVIGRAVP